MVRKFAPEVVLLGFTMVLVLKPDHTCGVISAVTELMVGKFALEVVLLGFTIVLVLKPGHTCDVTSAVTECMVDVAEVEARPYVQSNGTPLGRLILSPPLYIASRTEGICRT
jgi:hypothetical protein